MAGGVAFNASGDTLFLGSGLGIGHPTGIVTELIVLDRFAAMGVPLPGALWLMIGAVAGLAGSVRGRQPRR